MDVIGKTTKEEIDFIIKEYESHYNAEFRHMLKSHLEGNLQDGKCYLGRAYFTPTVGISQKGRDENGVIQKSKFE